MIAKITARMEADADENFSFERAAQAALAAIEAAGGVVVPVEPTFAMLEAALFANDNALLMSADCTDIRNAYAAMLAASPLAGGE
jgi:hypothetical protein